MWLKQLLLIGCVTIISVVHPAKILMLIIASDQFPVYVEEQKIWLSYMHSDPEHIEAYFIKSDPDLSVMYEIKDDVIWSKTLEGWIPHCSGILDKTLLSLEALLPRLDEFDYVVRTNLSSFFVFSRLLDFVCSLPKKQCYCGSCCGGKIGNESFDFATGSGFILSSDVATLLVKNKLALLGDASCEDDKLIGYFLKKNNIKHIASDRYDILSIGSWLSVKDHLPLDIFHFRLKNLNHDLRLTHEVCIQNSLLELFYGSRI